MIKKSLPPGEEETEDSFYHGRVRVLQGKRGYRFSVDAPLLADFIESRAGDDLIELGTGNGVIPILLSLKPFRHVTALEIQPGLAALARRNVALNGLDSRITIVEADFRSYDPGRRFDVVFSNPPYIRGAKSRLSRSEEKSIAKHEIKCDINDIMRGTRTFLKKEGRAYFVYSGKRRRDFLAAVDAQGLRLGILRPVLSRKGTEESLFLAECDFVSARPVLRKPMILYRSDGGYTDEAEAIFAGRTDS